MSEFKNRPLLFIVLATTDGATRDKCVFHVCWGGTYMWAWMFVLFLIFLKFLTFLCLVLKGYWQKVPVWNEKQNYPTFRLCFFFKLGLKGGESGVLLKAATSWQGSTSRNIGWNDYERGALHSLVYPRFLPWPLIEQQHKWLWEKVQKCPVVEWTQLWSYKESDCNIPIATS